MLATAFYGSSATLIPFGLEQAQLTELIAKASPDVLITEAGTLDIESVARGSSSLKEVLLVTKTGSEHMDWSEPGGKNGKTKVAVWKDLVVDSSASTEVPASEKDSEVAPLSTFWPTPNGKFEIVEYTSKVALSCKSLMPILTSTEHRRRHRSTQLRFASRSPPYSSRSGPPPLATLALLSTLHDPRRSLQQRLHSTQLRRR